jgi:UDP-2,3-diacylglucosamine pyrophosphatase LpxH
MLEDLQPDTAYYYRVNQEPPVSFFTPSDNGTVHFAVASDAHVGTEKTRKDLTVDMLAEISDGSHDFNMFFFLGDMVEYGFLKDQWQEAFETFSPVTSKIPVRFAAGNHDTLFSGFGNYMDYDYPEGMEIQSGSRLWYRVDAGNVHFFVLDLEWSAESYSSEQADWLKEQLASVPDGDWKIVMSHGFYYASGTVDSGWKWYDNSETIDKLTPLFEQYGVDLVFSGHNHRLELLENSGIVYVLCGAFGGLPDPEPTYISPSSIWRTDTGYGFMDVTLEGNLCTLTFRDADFQDIKTYTFNRD